MKSRKRRGCRASSASCPANVMLSGAVRIVSDPYCGIEASLLPSLLHRSVGPRARDAECLVQKHNTAALPLTEMLRLRRPSLRECPSAQHDKVEFTDTTGTCALLHRVRRFLCAFLDPVAHTLYTFLDAAAGLLRCLLSRCPGLVGGFLGALRCGLGALLGVFCGRLRGALGDVASVLRCLLGCRSR